MATLVTLKNINPFIVLDVFRNVWTYDAFINNVETRHIFKKYLKESCRLSTDQHFSLKYF